MIAAQPSTGARLAAQYAANVRAAATRRAMRADLRAAEARADWANLLTLLAQPGRRPDAVTVERMGRAAKVRPAEVRRVVALLGAAS